MTAVDLVCWTKLICFADVVELARCEIAAFRYRVLPVAARLTHAARRLHLRIDKTRRWAARIAAGFGRLRAAFRLTTRDPLARPKDRRPAHRQRQPASRRTRPCQTSPTTLNAPADPPP